MTLHLDQATALVSAAIDGGARRGETVCAAVTDAAGNLIAFGRSIGAPIPAIEITIGKAYTAGTLGAPTAALQAAVAPGGALYGLLDAARARPVVVLPGGAAILADGVRVGGLGVGGSADPATDQAIADEVTAG